MPKIASIVNVAKPDPNAWQLDRAYLDSTYSSANADFVYWKIAPIVTVTLSSTLYIEQFSILAQETSGTGIEFTPNGSIMYIIGSAGDDINKYTLSTPWNLNSATFVASYQGGSIGTVPSTLRFSSNGYYAYILDRATDTVTQYRCGTNYDVASLTSVSSFVFTTQDGTPTGIDFSPDGTYLMMTGGTNDRLYQYNLSTPWELSSTGYVQNCAFTTNPAVGTDLKGGIKFGPNGTIAYIITSSNIYEVTFTQAWNVATRITTAAGFETVNTTNYAITNEALTVDPRGSFLYTVSAGAEDVVVRWGLDKFKGGFNVAGQDTADQAIDFKPDGTRMYLAGQTGDVIYEYVLSTPWDINTATYLRGASIVLNPESLYFKPDGTSYYVLTASDDTVNRYNCSEAWNVATSSAISSFSVTLQENVPYGLFFKPDGTKMFIYGSGGDDITEYNLSTPWDITTAVFRANTASPLYTYLGYASTLAGEDIRFKQDGKTLYFLESSNNKIHFFNMTEAWNVSTISATNKSFLVTTASAGLANDFYIRDDGKLVYVLANGPSNLDTVIPYRVLNLY